MSIPMKTIPGYFNEKPGIQVGTKMEGDIRLGSDGRYIFDEQGVRFLKQMGVDWVMVGDVPSITPRPIRRCASSSRSGA